MEIALLGHIMGDFYLQTDKIAENKKVPKYMLIHCLIYTGCIFLSLLMMEGVTKLLTLFLITIIIGLLHAVVDCGKLKLEAKHIKVRRYRIFLLDQFIHIVVLVALTSVFHIRLGNTLYLPFVQIARNFIFKGLVRVTAMLICWKPAAIFIKQVFESIPKTIESAENDTECENDQNCKDEKVKIGSWIGILEREIILMLGFMGQFGAIGFVLTAKSLARYKQLENQAFAEKYLVGTLLSAGIAIGCVVGCAMVV